MQLSVVRRNACRIAWLLHCCDAACALGRLWRLLPQLAAGVHNNNSLLVQLVCMSCQHAWRDCMLQMHVPCQTGSAGNVLRSSQDSECLCTLQR